MSGGRRIKTVDAWAEPARVPVPAAEAEASGGPAAEVPEVGSGRLAPGAKSATYRLSVDLDRATAEALRGLAEADGRSLRSYAGRVLADHLARVRSGGRA